MRKNMGMYRAKLRDTGAWVYWNIYGELCRLNGKRARLPIPNKYGESYYYRVHQIKHLIDPETVGEYTGLTDKNSKKIFEGDIIRYGQIYDYGCFLESLDNPDAYDGETYDQDIEIDVVEWRVNNDYPAFDLRDHRFECNGLSQILCGDYEYEIIGNIHDNPELLEGQK